MNPVRILLTTILIFTITIGYSQKLTQTIRGNIIDKDSKASLEGASVVLLNSSPLIGALTDSAGNFRLLNVPVGRQNIKVTYIGYNDVLLNDLLLSSGKEMVLEIAMEEKVVSMEQVIVKAPIKKDRPINDMATVSARSFTIEETEKYAGSRGDVARMASNFAGVSFANDSRNDIIIRGNSPSGLLWRLEDTDVPNPNHFAENGTTGGPVGMLNNNVLKNSDFFSGAFPAEYGNALSGVFDLKMRNGNNEKHEYVLQYGFNGFELGAEGPFTHNKNSSYLVNYRYSTLKVMSKMGIDFGTSGIPKYQDGSFKINIPVKNGQITWFGLGGISQITMLDKKSKGNDMYQNEGMDIYNGSSVFTTGLSYTRFINSKNYLKTVLSGFYQEGHTKADTIDTLETPHRIYNNTISESRLSFSIIYGTKFSSKFNSKAGITIDQMAYSLNANSYNYDSLRLIDHLKDSKGFSDGINLIRSFYETNYKFSDVFTISPGVQVMYFTLNKQISLEPRFGVSWNYGFRRKFNLGYGYHSHTQPLSTYYYKTGGITETNKNLGFTKSHQFVAGHDWSITENLRLKTEIYYQYLFNVPVEKRPTYFSMLNTGSYWGINTEDSLVNKGTGRNYGVEITFEKFFGNNYYFLFTLSLFDSKYKGSNGIERNTTFNGHAVLNFLVGKEFPISKRSVITSDLKLTFAGGRPYTPIDTLLSGNQYRTVYFLEKTNEIFYPDFLKIDVKAGLRVNGTRVSQEWQIYIENVTDHKNVLYQDYSQKQRKIKTIYQLGFFPVGLYRLNF